MSSISIPSGGLPEGRDNLSQAAAGRPSSSQRPVSKTLYSVEQFRSGVDLGQAGKPVKTFEAELEKRAGREADEKERGARDTVSKAQEEAPGSPREAYLSKPYRGRRAAQGPTRRVKTAREALQPSELTEQEQLDKLGKIRKSAQDYEGILMAEMVKAMRQAPMAKTPGGDIYRDIAEKPFTAALAAAGGLGLADKIVSSVAAQEGLSETLAAHPEVMGPGWQMKIAPSHLRKPAHWGYGSPESQADTAKDSLAQSHPRKEGQTDTAIGRANGSRLDSLIGSRTGSLRESPAALAGQDSGPRLKDFSLGDLNQRELSQEELSPGQINLDSPSGPWAEETSSLSQEEPLGLSYLSPAQEKRNPDGPGHSPLPDREAQSGLAPYSQAADENPSRKGLGQERPFLESPIDNPPQNPLEAEAFWREENESLAKASKASLVAASLQSQESFLREDALSSFAEYGSGE
jgi:Rod binding domain-containing protein